MTSNVQPQTCQIYFHRSIFTRGLKSAESMQTNDFTRSLDQISANQHSHGWREKKSNNDNCLSLEDGLAYTSFPVQQRWNLKCYCNDITVVNSIMFTQFQKKSHVRCSFHPIMLIVCS